MTIYQIHGSRLHVFMLLTPLGYDGKSLQEVWGPYRRQSEKQRAEGGQKNSKFDRLWKEYTLNYMGILNMI